MLQTKQLPMVHGKGDPKMAKEGCTNTNEGALRAKKEIIFLMEKCNVENLILKKTIQCAMSLEVHN